MRKKLAPLRKYAENAPVKKKNDMKVARAAQAKKREERKQETLRKKTLDEELVIEEAIDNKRQDISKQLFGKESKLNEMGKTLIKSAGTEFIQVLPSKFKSGRTNAFRIIYNKNKFSRYSNSFTRTNIKTFGNHINQFLKDNGIKKGEITLNLNYNGVVRSSGYIIGDNVAFYDFSDYSPSDEQMKEANYFNSINKFDSISFFISAKKKKTKI